MNRLLVFSSVCVGFGSLMGGGSGIVVSGALADETATRVLAAQIRRQGFTCDNPQSASRDAERSKPASQVWVLLCENATYRVRAVPKMAAKVERIDQE